MVKVKATVIMFQATRYCESHFEGETITVEEYDELIKNREEAMSLDKQAFSEFLAENYTTDEVFAMTEEEKQNVRKDFESRCQDWAFDEIKNEWEHLEFHTEVEIADKDLAEITPKKPNAKCPCPCNQ